MKKTLVVIAAISLLALVSVSSAFAQKKAGPGPTPVYGGVLREVASIAPRVLGYFPEFGPDDQRAILPAVEKLMEYDQSQQLAPFLAESVTVAPDEKSITFKLRKGIKFHDGSDFNADAVAWNYQLAKDTKSIQYNSKIVRIEVVDNYTVRLHISQYNNQLLYSYGWFPILSKQAWDKAGGGNVEKAKEWARSNAVGTGPFKLGEFKRDNYLRWVKNENYWQKGKPYLDGILVRYIPDPVTISSMMQAKEADMWTSWPPDKDQQDLEKKGFIRQSGFGLPRVLFINNKDPNSKWQNKKLREALEYAIDKPAIAKALGFGYYTPLVMLAPPGVWGYDPDYKGRPYDPAKAKQLLSEAGYPNGITVKMLVMAVRPWPDEAQAIKRYLDEVGITVDIDVADPGRFFSAMWKDGWPDLLLNLHGMDLAFLVSLHRTIGPEPMSNLASFKRPPEMSAIAEKSLTLKSEKDQKEATRQWVKNVSDEALLIPLYLVPRAYIIQPWVHTTFLKEHTVARHTGDEWMEKH
jgi:peptide/nickel transport system substrate-binding protein